MSDYLNCQGCALCLLSCPMWLQQRDVGFSPQGIFKALQAGEDLAVMQSTLTLCLDCGACDVLCPENIKIGAAFDGFRQDLAMHRSGYEDNGQNEAFSLLFDKNIRKKIKKTDFYVISAALFHKNHVSRVAFYTLLQQETGCSMNLDLQRNAIPTAINTALDAQQQMRWLCQGREFERMIVEDKADMNALAAFSGKVVIHVSSLSD